MAGVHSPTHICSSLCICQCCLRNLLFEAATAAARLGPWLWLSRGTAGVLTLQQAGAGTGPALTLAPGLQPLG